MALNWFKKLKSGLSKSASKVEGAIASITGKKTIDQETLNDIEDQLILADLGVEVAGRIAKKIKDQKFELDKNKEIEKTQIAKTLAEEIEQILLPREQNLYEKVNSKPHVLLLAGVTANFFFASLVMFIHYLADFSQSFTIIRWLMGGLDITDYKTILTVFPIVFIGIFILLFVSRDLNLISTGVHSASSRGVNVKKIQKIGFVTASLITGTVVATCGPIGFVGLIVPHIVRLFVGPDLRILIPASMLFGASFLVICDTFARTLLAPTEIPVGIITAMLGGPFFVWLLKRKRPV